MKNRDRRLKSIQTELAQMYEDLFGGQYVPGLQNAQKSEFNSIIEAFRERIFYVRQTQQERQKKEKKKGFKQSTQQTKLNQQIREQIKKAEGILGEAVRRMKNDLKVKQGKQKESTSQVIANRQKMIKNSYELLKDVKEIESGGVYKPPQPVQTLDQIKKLLVTKDNDEDEEINLEQEVALHKFKKKDQQIDDMLEEVINVDGQIKRQLLTANEMIEGTNQLIKKNMNKADAVGAKIQKGNTDLIQVLKHYRKPNKLCLDIIFVLLLLALIGVIINMARSSSI